MALVFDQDFAPAHGEAVTLFPGVVRVTANNPGPFTFHGTNTYLVGEDELAVIDPGPDSAEHFDALVRAIRGRRVRSILVSHTHRDHSPLARRLAMATGAPTYAEGPHRPARPSQVATPFENGADLDFEPDFLLADGDVVPGDGWALQTVLTPGHAANHAGFALAGTGLLFSADHVMAWSTTIVAPPDGSMADYMASLDKLIERGDSVLLPGHGGAVEDPQNYLRGLKEHRLAREKAILEGLAGGDQTVGELVEAIYKDIDPRLRAAAGLSVLAHLDHLHERGLVATDGVPSVGGIFRAV